jgi:predicted transcriptional regulator
VRYRRRTEIAASILQTTKNGPATKTRITYDSYLSFVQTNYYLDYLIEHRLIRHDKSTNRYSITEKGIKFLGTYSKMDDLLPGKPGDRTMQI